MDLEELKSTYNSYVDTFRDGRGNLPAMMQLKSVHTAHVVANAVAIARGEGFDAALACSCEAAALLHDTGRYEQMKRYNTFRDADSVDHAAFSHAIVREKGWLDGFPHADAILTAVLCHNRREIPDDLDDFTEQVAHVVRDADKLDIFRVLEDEVATPDWKHECKAFWSLPVMAPPSRAVVDAIRESRTVDYHDIKTLADFVMVQVGWIVCGLHYATSRRLCAERRHLDFRRSFLHKLTNDSTVDEVCDIAAGAEMGAMRT